MKKNLVTGGLGFVGSHLVDILLQDSNNQITVVDNLCSESSSKSYMRKEVRYLIEDVMTSSACLIVSYILFVYTVTKK